MYHICISFITYETIAGLYDGVAPDAKIVFIDLGSPGSGIANPGANNLYSPGKSAGARVHTNSWGTFHKAASYYTSSDVDQYLYKNMDMTILFAAGNFGGDGPNSVSLEAQSKNVVSVGSSQTLLDSNNVKYVAFYSSQGPSFDGRIKPEIVAPGDSLMSAESNGYFKGQSCNLIEMTGTSMASPAAAGAAALIRNYYNGVKFWVITCNKSYASCQRFTPSGVLVKATLLHSGDSMVKFNGQEGGKLDVNLNAPPDNTQGYGRILLLNVLPLPGANTIDLFVDDMHLIGESTKFRYYVHITNPNNPLKLVVIYLIQISADYLFYRVTISWYDPPSINGVASSVLIHNLDLTVTTPTNSM